MIISARHNWPEPPGFTINRPAGMDNYTFLHFFTPVSLTIDGTKKLLQPGACLIYAPDTPQWFRSDGELLHDWMHLSPEAGALLTRYDIPINQVFYPADTSFITASVYKIELEFYGYQEHRQEMASLELQQMLIYLSRVHNKVTAAPVLTAEMSAILGHFRLNLMWHKHEHWTLQRMAAEMKMSVSRFCAVYKAQFGISPMNDLIQMRIDAAKNLLTGSKVSISDLASQLGYANTTHFNRQFKKNTGLSPTAYAEANKPAAQDRPCLPPQSI